MIYENKNQLKKGYARILELDGSDIRILDEKKLKDKLNERMEHFKNKHERNKEEFWWGL